MPTEQKQNNAEVVIVERIVRPTKKQAGILEFIDSFIAQHGYSPSYREIMVGLDYTSVATVALHINNLIRRGHLRKRNHSARSLELVKPLAKTSVASEVKTNLVKPSDEKWIVDKISYFFDLAESEAVTTEDDIRKLEVLIEALSILSLEPAAQQFKDRLKLMEKMD